MNNLNKLKIFKYIVISYKKKCRPIQFYDASYNTCFNAYAGNELYSYNIHHYSYYSIYNKSPTIFRERIRLRMEEKARLSFFFIKIMIKINK